MKSFAKKISILIVLLIMIATLSACGNGSGNTSKDKIDSSLQGTYNCTSTVNGYKGRIVVGTNTITLTNCTVSTAKINGVDYMNVRISTNALYADFTKNGDTTSLRVNNASVTFNGNSGTLSLSASINTKTKTITFAGYTYKK